MNPENAARRDETIGRWVWLLPAAYAFHVIEEGFGGRGLVEWMIARGGLRLSMASFLGANLVGLAIIAVATWGSRTRPSWRWVLASAGTILFVNGLSHVAASVGVGYYVPGMWTGIAFYLPLGAILLARMRRLVRPKVFWAAIGAGFAIHAAVLWWFVFGAPGL